MRRRSEPASRRPQAGVHDNERNPPILCTDSCHRWHESVVRFEAGGRGARGADVRRRFLCGCEFGGHDREALGVGVFVAQEVAELVGQDGGQVDPGRLQPQPAAVGSRRMTVPVTSASWRSGRSTSSSVNEVATSPAARSGACDAAVWPPSWWRCRQRSPRATAMARVSTASGSATSSANVVILSTGSSPVGSSAGGASITAPSTGVSSTGVSAAGCPRLARPQRAPQQPARPQRAHQRPARRPRAPRRGLGRPPRWRPSRWTSRRRHAGETVERAHRVAGGAARSGRPQHLGGIGLVRTDRCQREDAGHHGDAQRKHRGPRRSGPE